MNKSLVSTNFSEYSKMILEKVCFDKHLFEKELAKSLKYLKPNQKKELMNWCYERFGYRGNQAI